MDNQKIENLLNLSLWASPEERMRSAPLGAGYDPEDQTFEVVIRYQGDPSFLAEAALSSTLLLGNYAILRLSREALERVSLLPRVTFMEMPKSLYFAAADGRAASCINPVQSGSAAGVPLTGKGVLLACLDSGVDYTHPDFRRPDGSTRILRLWDQTVPDGPPRKAIIWEPSIRKNRSTRPWLPRLLWNRCPAGTPPATAPRFWALPPETA